MVLAAHTKLNSMLTYKWYYFRRTSCSTAERGSLSPQEKQSVVYIACSQRNGANNTCLILACCHIRKISTLNFPTCKCTTAWVRKTLRFFVTKQCQSKRYYTQLTQHQCNGKQLLITIATCMLFFSLKQHQFCTSPRCFHTDCKQGCWSVQVWRSNGHINWLKKFSLPDKYYIPVWVDYSSSPYWLEEGYHTERFSD